PNFELGYMGHEVGERLRLLLRRAAQRLARATLHLLLKVILMDPVKRLENHGSGARGKPANGGGSAGPDVENDGFDSPDMLKSLVQVYGSREAWLNFFADKEQQRNFCHNVSGSILTIGHEDLECSHATPPAGDGTMSFFN